MNAKMLLNLLSLGCGLHYRHAGAQRRLSFEMIPDPEGCIIFTSSLSERLRQLVEAFPLALQLGKTSTSHRMSLDIDVEFHHALA